LVHRHQIAQFLFFATATYSRFTMWKVNISRTRRGAQSGVGLIDTLVALTLLALSLLGASSTLVRTLAANRAAALQTTAVDLAADLAEDRRAGSSLLDEAAVRDWNRRVAMALPIGTPPLEQAVAGSGVTLRWWDPAIHRPTDFSLQSTGTWPGGTP
jgi:type II secretory pathway pseudopilin PulG